MKREILLEIERNREIMGIKPLIMEGFSLLLTEAVDLTKLWEKIFERTTEAEVEGAISRNSRLFETGGEKLSEKIANRPRMGAGVKSIQEITEEFLQKVARQDTEKFIQMIDRLSIELPEFAIDLAIITGENTVSYKGNSVKVYEILEKWWNLHGNEFNSVDRFKTACKSTGEALNIPPHTMKILGESVMYANTGTSDRVVTEVMDHFGASTRRTLERTTEEGLEELLAKITEKDMDEFSEGVFEGSIVGPDGYLNVNAPTVIDYCLNRAPDNVKKYFRTKYLDINNPLVKDLKIKVPFSEINVNEKIAQELELVKGTLGKFKNDQFTKSVEDEINRHITSKLPSGWFKKSWIGSLCNKQGYGAGEYLRDIRSKVEYTKKMSESKRGICIFLEWSLKLYAVKVLCVDLGLPLVSSLMSIAQSDYENGSEVIREFLKDVKGTLTAEDTDEIEAFYSQSPDYEIAREPDNHRFNPNNPNGYFEVKVYVTENGPYGEQKVLSDWQIVKYIGGVYTLEDSKSWWDKTKEKGEEKIEDIKNNVDSLRNN
jgi:hypothetical protein